ncbi:MAG: helix-turn-helix domain-containing protein [Ruminococcaceae bacterium]|nr:helix-turn-helix domain-containing protein [Oscillospiraceae bacterium]
MKEAKFSVTEVPFAFRRIRSADYRLHKSERNSNGLVLLLSGELTMTIDGAQRTAHAGNLLLPRKGDTYTLRAISPSGVDFIVISYQAEPLDVLFDLLPDRIFQTDHVSRYRNAFESAIRIQDSRGICHESLMCALVQEILCNIIRENYPAMLSNERNPVEYAKQYIEEFYSSDLSADHIASVVGISPSYLRALFKKGEGESPIHYLNRIRIERAKEMISSNMFTLEEIARSCGFQNVYYFNRVFKSFTGITPGKY